MNNIKHLILENFWKTTIPKIHSNKNVIGALVKPSFNRIPVKNTCMANAFLTSVTHQLGINDKPLKNKITDWHRTQKLQDVHDYFNELTGNKHQVEYEAHGPEEAIHNVKQGKSPILIFQSRRASIIQGSCQKGEDLLKDGRHWSGVLGSINNGEEATHIADRMKNEAWEKNHFHCVNVVGHDEGDDTFLCRDLEPKYGKNGYFKVPRWMTQKGHTQFITPHVIQDKTK